MAFRGFAGADPLPRPVAYEAWRPAPGALQGVDGRPKRATAQRDPSFVYNDGVARRAAAPQPRTSNLRPIEEEPPRSPEHTPGGTSTDPEAYAPFTANVAEALVSAAAESTFEAYVETAMGKTDCQRVPITDWYSAPVAPRDYKSFGKRLPGGERMVEIEVALSDDKPPSSALLAAISSAFRADSPDAPSTHADAVRRGPIWIESEGKELSNQRKNGSWETITRDELPPGRRLHKLIWVYKVKRDGTCKSRLCVQGTTLEEGIDYEQVFSAALRYSSARALFAFAARNGCKVRSVDLVAAYLQGRFVEGEVVYCHLPVGYPEFDSKGRPKIAKVVKPIYGIQQAGRRLQRMLFDWLIGQGFAQKDASDPCIFIKECADGEILAIGVYVDNLQIVHSAQLDKSGRGPDGCEYNKFMDALSTDWDVTDEGPMEDLLGIEIEYNSDGSIKLHQRKYIEKVVKRFLPDGPSAKVQKNSLPYSSNFLKAVDHSLAATEVLHPELVSPMQERVGCLMYAATSTRPDIAYPVHQLCKCMHKPSHDLMREIDHLLSYLARTASVGLTYSREHARLSGYADASWEVKNSTSGWVVSWQSAAISWGSRKQKCVALSSCEAEIIALSEAAKDVVYLRKLVNDLGAPEPDPSKLRTDSQSARDVSYNPEQHDRMKHVERRHFFVRDMVEKFELEVPFVRTHENIADFFTKPMVKEAKRFHEFRRIIMNERD